MSKPLHVAYICPRFSEGTTVGGAETLLKNLAIHTASAGHRVTFLTTCATDHFSWRNDVPAGRREIDGLDVEFFPVDEERDIDLFVWPETVLPCYLTRDRECETTMNRLAQKTASYHLVGALSARRVNGEMRHFNSCYQINPNGTVYFPASLGRK